MLDFIYMQLFTFILLFSSYFLFKYAAKGNINGWFGYRTPASSRNQENWYFANNRCAKLVLRASFINLVIGMILIIVFYFGLLYYYDWYVYIASFQIAITFIFIIVDIERKLKEKREKNNI